MSWPERLTSILIMLLLLVSLKVLDYPEENIPDDIPGQPEDDKE